MSRPSSLICDLKLTSFQTKSPLPEAVLSPHQRSRYLACMAQEVGSLRKRFRQEIADACLTLDPGIKINIHSAISGYTVPGPKVIAEGTSVTPGNAVCSKKKIRGANDIFGF